MRKHLGFSVTEWDRLPWWQQRLYIEELAADLYGDEQPANELASDGDLAALGFNVQ